MIPSGQVFSYQQHTPEIHAGAYVAPGAMVIGQVRLADQVSVWFNCVLRGDLGPIEIGPGSNIQDLTTIHVEGAEERGDGRMIGTVIGRNVTVGHSCVIHSCVIEDEALIGMGSVVLGSAVIGRGAIVGAGAVVLDEAVIPPFSLVVGSPGKVKKTYPETVIEDVIRVAARAYQARVQAFREGLKPFRP